MNAFWASRRRRLRAIPWAALLYALLSLSSCSPRDELAGEWAIQLSGSDSTASVTGLIVFDPRISSYGPSLPEGIPARLYLDWRPLRGAAGSAGPHYMNETSGDMYEEVDALISEDGEITLVVAPQVFGHDPVLTGRAVDGRVVGKWVYASHSDTLASGSFRMRPTQRSAATDSAIARSRRAEANWHDGNPQ